MGALSIPTGFPACFGRPMVEYRNLSEGTVRPPAGEVTELLRAWSAGDRSVEDRLFRLVMPELRALSRYLMHKERRDHTLQPSALLNEAYVRLLAARERDWENRRHFFAVAARVMRRLLIDHARAQRKAVALKAEISDELQDRDARLELAVDIDLLLDELERTHPDWCSIVELRYFMGLTDTETAEALGVPLRTMQRRYADARRWLYVRLSPESCKTKRIATSS
jgi:RNA polymerase sigma factor (TIGR02999 family)